MRRSRRLPLVLSWLLVLGLLPVPWGQLDQWQPLLDARAIAARAAEDEEAEAPRPEPIRAASRPQFPTAYPPEQVVLQQPGPAALGTVTPRRPEFDFGLSPHAGPGAVVRRQAPGEPSFEVELRLRGVGGRPARQVGRETVFEIATDGSGALPLATPPSVPTVVIVDEGRPGPPPVASPVTPSATPTAVGSPGLPLPSPSASPARTAIVGSPSVVTATTTALPTTGLPSGSIPAAATPTASPTPSPTPTTAAPPPPAGSPDPLGTPTRAGGFSAPALAIGAQAAGAQAPAPTPSATPTAGLPSGSIPAPAALTPTATPRGATPTGGALPPATPTTLPAVTPTATPTAVVALPSVPPSRTPTPIGPVSPTPPPPGTVPPIGSATPVGTPGPITPTAVSSATPIGSATPTPTGTVGGPGPAGNVYGARLELRYEPSPDGLTLKETVVLHERPRTSVLSYDFTLRGVSVQARADGGLDLLDQAGRPAFQIPAPTFHDASGRAGAASYRLSPGTLEVALDPGLLAGGALPFAIDPSVVVISDSGLLANAGPAWQRQVVTARDGTQAFFFYDSSAGNTGIKLFRSPDTWNTIYGAATIVANQGAGGFAVEIDPTSDVIYLAVTGVDSPNSSLWVYPLSYNPTAKDWSVGSPITLQSSSTTSWSGATVVLERGSPSSLWVGADERSINNTYTYKAWYASLAGGIPSSSSWSAAFPGFAANTSAPHYGALVAITNGVVAVGREGGSQASARYLRGGGGWSGLLTIDCQVTAGSAPAIYGQSAPATGVTMV